MRSWPEIQQIFEWTRDHAHASMFVCWGAMAALYHFHGAPKRLLNEKAFGVYPQRILKPTSPYLAGFADIFATPISRWAQIEPSDLALVLFRPPDRSVGRSERIVRPIPLPTGSSQVFSVFLRLGANLIERKSWATSASR